MADQVIDFMREQFARVHQRFDKIELSLSEHGTRLQRVEREIVGLHQGMANMHSDYAMFHRRLDNVSERLERIERRLDRIEGSLYEHLILGDDDDGSRN